MKRALQANINNKIFYIDEDAYGLLQNYLRQLSDAFSGPEGQEIVNDIECRVSELLSEKVEKGKNVIDIQCIYQVINTIGSPEELGAQAGPQYPDSENTPPPYKGQKPPKKLYRDPNNRIFGGVIGGLCKYFGWEAWVMRVLLVLLALSTAVMPMVILYLIAWMIIPLANNPRKKLEMEGREVTFDSVAQSLRDSAQAQMSKVNSANVGHAATTFLGTVGKIIAGLIAVGFGAAGFAALIGLFVFMSFFFMGIWGDSTWLVIHGVDHRMIQYLPMACAWLSCCCLAACIVSTVAVWCIGAMVFDWKGISKSALLTLALIMAVVIAGILVMSIYFSRVDVSPFWF